MLRFDSKEDKEARKRYIDLMYSHKSENPMTSLTALKRENPERYEYFRENSRIVSEYCHKRGLKPPTPETYDALEKEALMMNNVGGQLHD